MAITRPRGLLAQLRRPTQKRQDYLTALVCLAPWVVGFLSFTLGPMLYSFGLSFFEADLLTGSKFLGLANYTSLFRDPLFLKSLRVTATYAFVSVPLGVVVSLSVAMLLNQKIVGLSGWRTVYYMPSLISGVAVSVLWLQIFNPRMGLLNGILKVFGIQGPSWIFDSNWALPSLIIMSVWSIGATMLLYLAGLQGIPTELYEAAEIDGAGKVRKFANITIPMLTPTIFFNSLIGIIAAFQLFTQAMVMTGGGPNNATLTMVLFLYRKAFQQTRFGYASAVAWILFGIIVVFTVLYVRFSDRWVFYAGQENN
jgi:multiple sugar transport system permease protein